MEKRELTKLLPKDSYDIEAAEILVKIGYPTVAPILKSLFQWLETSGSPVELIMRPFFATLGEPAFDLVQDALRAKIKPARKHCLLRYVLPAWPKELIARLEPELMSYVVNGPEFHGLDVYALSLLINKNIGDKEELQRWRKFKIERFNLQLQVLQNECEKDFADHKRESI